MIGTPTHATLPMRTVFVFALVLSSLAFASARDDLLLYLRFDDSQTLDWSYGDDDPESFTTEEVTGTRFRIGGLASRVDGVSGTALKFDGFSSFVEGSLASEEEEDGEEDEEVGDDDEGDDGDEQDEDEEEDEEEEGPQMPRAITVEAWIALSAYPWNWAPILTVGKYKITGFYFGVDSRGRLGFHVSDATSVWHECNSSVDAETKLGMELRRWHHVVGTYDPEKGLAIYIDGKLAGTYSDFQFDYGIAYSDLERGFRIGRNRADLTPTDPIRDWATYPSGYAFDGIIDEIKVHKTALSGDEIAHIYRSNRPQQDPPLAPRRFPQVASSGRFAANYTRLKYYPEWDALWPPGDHLDAVVQFDEYPTKLVFWRGTRYSPCWVSENGKWLADQSRETGHNWFLGEGPRETMPTGCIEHMSDTQCRSSRVAIIHSNAARCVVNWRYLQMDVKFRQQDVPNNTGFGQWGNEYYYVYPDGLCVRHVLRGYGGWQETIFLNEPGTRPEDNVELSACTLVNMEGASKTYSWEDGYPEFDLDDAVIQMINFKSQFKPFLIFRDGGGFEVFNLEVRPDYSHFPWWNHWPVAQVISDGRSASAPDRASHSSLSWGDPNGKAALYGMTRGSAESLVPLARSWNLPPELAVRGAAYQTQGYDYTQRAYILQTVSKGEPLSLDLACSSEQPLFNLVLVVRDWGGGEARVSIDGAHIPAGKNCRVGFEYDASGRCDLVCWIKHRATQHTKLCLTREGEAPAEPERP